MSIFKLSIEDEATIKERIGEMKHRKELLFAENPTRFNFKEWGIRMDSIIQQTDTYVMDIEDNIRSYLLQMEKHVENGQKAGIPLTDPYWRAVEVAIQIIRAFRQDVAWRNLSFAFLDDKSKKMETLLGQTSRMEVETEFLKAQKEMYKDTIQTLVDKVGMGNKIDLKDGVDKKEVEELKKKIDELTKKTSTKEPETESNVEPVEEDKKPMTPDEFFKKQEESYV